MFLNTNDRVINLENVSSINLLKDKNRIIFNLNYSIEMMTDKGMKYISDYVYWDGINESDFLENRKHVYSNSYFMKNFIRNYNGSGFINTNSISSVKFSDKKYRVIFNLNHPVTFKDYDGVDKLTSEYVYVNCGNYGTYQDYVSYVKRTLDKIS